MLNDAYNALRYFYLPLIAGMLAMVLIVVLLIGCVPTPASTPRPDYQATIDVALADKAACGEGWYQTMGALNQCLTRPTGTPNVVVWTPVPPTPTAVALVSCKDAPIGTKVVVTQGTTARYWHDEISGKNLGYAQAGASGTLIDKSMDADALWWWRVQGLRTGDFPYGSRDGEPLKAWVKAIYSACVPPK
jgi:hypothetical protein